VQNASFTNKWSGYLSGVLGIAVTTGVLMLFGERINSTTVALALLLVVLLIATKWGSGPAVLTAILGVVCLNFFYLPPVGRFSIAAADNWVALVAFLVTAVIAGQLSARARRRAEEANVARGEIERLYHELQDTFERSSQAKALKQSERLKSALLDAVTHDLRTPLTSIKASVTTLLEELQRKKTASDPNGLDAAGRKEMLDVINEEADRLDRFIEGLMELARIEAGEIQLRKQWGSVEEIIQAALKRAEPLTRRHRLEIRLDHELPSVKVDERAVAEVIYTLVDNAAKYSPEGTIIHIRAASGGDGTINLSVADEGPGVPRDLRERVFDKFFRAMRDGDAGVNKLSGSGMGLAIAKGIVEAHGGRIWIEDASESRGANVVVSLPTGD
jgi:two-component system sensor histidine kinase KdpD